MPLVQLEVENFKSYRGKQILGPFDKFTAVIGPNGSGKSNLMDAISFVLGVRSAQLRSTQLRDLIYRGRRAGDVEDDDDDETAGEGTASTANVTAVFEDSTGRQHRFQRSITANGSSEYRLNGRVLNASTYISKLQGFNILVKAKNFLVFQGDVEAIASQNAKDLCRLVDQISGSLEHKDAYDTAKAAQQRAEENSTFAYHKRRGINSELKQFKEQKGEAEKFEKLQLERVSLKTSCNGG
ncbi:P-loop containing nucleoside triphosphate hydrolase protein [Acaromyces ingoldii]|uniref:P-loop containing nucleoside triphosphate hydrolase protein n=1 Tax=Acaromyces ingoldii TaxID=215250 RepID=A0A316YGK0_9BASI|nr:P-loop containing nucleoside triphosphate hydrolase protein [Acaromyces ingoldii]PWN88292.1 P-loop containing nucleoside triphosphate hydrolase protein [Acaromyces ingoldii]